MDGVTDNKARSRFELPVGDLVAIAAYERNGSTITFTHTVVPEELEGRGVGSRLVAAALDGARTDGLRVVPACGFVKAFIAKHPQYADLV